MSAAFIKRVAEAALQCFEATIAELGLQGGKRQGPEYLPLNPKRSDSKPGSFSINRNTGAWSDFATDDKGGDLVSLAAYLWDLKNGDAAERLGAVLGIKKTDRPENDKGASKPSGKAKPSTRPKESNGGNPGGPVCVMPVPADAPAPPRAHMKHGKPVKRWAYRDAAGAVNFYHDRYEPKGERKQFAPLTLWREPSGRLVWQFKAPPEPRPLMNLEQLAGNPSAVVVLVEGEKAADAAAVLLPEAVIMTWQGGAQAVEKADFAPLARRVVWLWPDADKPGGDAMSKAAVRLRKVNAADLQCINLECFAQAPGSDAEGKPVLSLCESLAEGDDAADLLARGWTAGHMAQAQGLPGFLVNVYAEHNHQGGPSQNVDAARNKGKARQQTPEMASGPAKRHFFTDDEGVYFVDVRDGAYMPPRWVCSRLDVLAMVRDPVNHGWGRLVAFADPDGVRHRVIIPMELFKGDGLEVAGLLLGQGLNLAPKARPLLVEYLQTAETNTRARITARTGWHDGGVFVLPDRAYGATGEEWIFESDSPAANTFKQRGSLDDWRQNVGRLCRGNSRLIFAASVTFAAPLLHLVGAESGGLHFRSNSSDGKTTALRVAASVCGGPEYMQRWRATDNGLEALAMQHCDAALLLDELAQLEPKAAGEVAYMLANGSGKNRANRNGGARARSDWRLLFLSAGEISLAQHMMEAGKVAKAGQELRMAEIPADAGAGLGVFEELHGYPSGAAFAKALDQAARKHYGTAWAAWLEYLAQDAGNIADEVHHAHKMFVQRFLTDGASGQAQRVAERFAKIGAAGELATEKQITGWEPGEAMQAAGVCFRAWLANRGGEGHQEERVMLSQVREFLERHGEARFADWDRPVAVDNHAPRVINKAGVRKRDEAADATEYFIYPEVFRSEVCRGFDHKAVCKLLVKRACLGELDKDGKPRKVTLPGEGSRRVFHVQPSIWWGE